MSAEFKIEGMEQFQRKIEKLTNPKKAKSIARKAARQAMNIVRDAARSNAKAIDDTETSEMIQKNIAVQGGKTSNSNEIRIRVGVRGGASRNQHSVSTSGLSGGDTRHWRYVEFGTSKTKAQPYMRPVLESNIQNATDAFAEKLQADLMGDIK